MHEKEVQVALAAVVKAANLCQRVQASVTRESLEKRDKSPVTVADFGSQAIIAQALRAAFPTVPLIAEEDSSALMEPGNASSLERVLAEVRQEISQPGLSADELCSWIDHGGASEYSELFWTLDPIDGTKGFLRGEQYAIALALVEKGEPVCAILACPNLGNDADERGAYFVAQDGKARSYKSGNGAQSQDAPGQSEAVSVSPATELSKFRFCESVESAHSDHNQSQAIADALGIRGESVRMDSQAKYASVARGDAEIYLRLPTRKGYVERIWDHAAGYAILKAAGGRITDVDGRDLDFRHGRGLDDNRGIIASNGVHHQALVEAVASSK